MVHTSQRFAWTLASLVLLSLVTAMAAHAQATPDADPTQLVERTADQPERDRGVEIGLFTAYTPAFLGSKDYQLIAGPNIQVRYDRAFLSMQDGLGYDVIRSGGFRAGALIGFRPARRENGDNPFKIAGDSSASAFNR